MEVNVINISGKETGAKVQLPDAIFAVKPNDHAIYLDVKQYLANQRQGTHKSKQRNEIAGSTRKLYKQKGTGGARAGSIKSPLFNGGGRVFGPRPRNYSFKLNKKLKAVARLSALSSMAKDNKIALVENIEMNAAKTKDFISILSNLKMSDKKTLMVTGAMNQNVVLSSRNLPKVKVAVAADLATYDILNAEALLLTEESINTLEQLYSNK